MFFIVLCVVVLLPSGFSSINETCLPFEEGNDWNLTMDDPCLRDPHRHSNLTYENKVICSVPNDTLCHVVEVILTGQSLPGILPPEFANLRYLQNLNLSRNCLSGTIPLEWGSMEKIQNIYLLGNCLTGSIPKELGNISTLKFLNVEDNMMSGTIPGEIANLAGLEKLSLNSNSFTGELPASFEKLVNLKEFWIGGNNLSGKIPDFIRKLTNLTSLRIQGSGLKGPIPPSITLLPNLLDLRISDLKGPNALCPPFSNTTPFRNLILRSCNLIGMLPDSFDSEPLEVLDLSFNKFNGSIPESYDKILQNKEFYIYLTGNLLSGSVPSSMLDIGQGEKRIDLSYNNFTFESSRESDCQMGQTNLFSSFSRDNISKVSVSCLRENHVCSTYWSSLYINCGGGRLQFEDKVYEADDHMANGWFYNPIRQWGFSTTGHHLDDECLHSNIVTSVSNEVQESKALYKYARASAISLTYYGLCMHNGNYTVSLHFAEIFFNSYGTYGFLGRRVFDIYIQGVPVVKDFDISDKAGGMRKTFVANYTVNVTSNDLEIRLYWAGKGTTSTPFLGKYGPLISAISVNPNFQVSQKHGGLRWVVIGLVCAIILIFLGVVWWWRYLRRSDFNKLDLNGLELNTVLFTLRQIEIATNNFNVANKIGEGGFGSVYKGVLPDGTLIAVKQLSSRSRQGNREFLNELGVISALQHPHLVRLLGCCIDGNQLLLAYEYMENNSLARALYGYKEPQLALNWTTRYKICLGIARGLTFLHEESTLKIVHRDIKTANVLLDKNLDARISDFGLAKLDEEESTHISTRVAGTYGYMAPEYALRGYLTDKADVYSFGIVLLEIVSGMANVADRANENNFVLLERAIVLKKMGNLLELVDARLESEYNIQEMMVVIHLALMCTTMSPTDRPTMSSVVRMLEERIVPREFVVGQSVSMRKIDRDGISKQLGILNESRRIQEFYTDSSTSTADLYPDGGFSEYLQRRESDKSKLIS